MVLTSSPLLLHLLLIDETLMRKILCLEDVRRPLHVLSDEDVVEEAMRE